MDKGHAQSCPRVATQLHLKRKEKGDKGGADVVWHGEIGVELVLMLRQRAAEFDAQAMLGFGDEEVSGLGHEGGV